jgi:SAM-dependent methyltransferase
MSAMREDDIRPKALLDEFFVRLQRDAARLAARRHEFIEVPCPFCGGTALRGGFEKQGFRYEECAGCGSLYTSPRPTPDLLRWYLEASEAVEFWSTHFYRETAAARRQQMFRPRAARMAALADQYELNADAACVDIGAGYGLFVLELAALKRFGRILAIEPDARLAGVCRDHGFPVVEQWVEDLTEGQVAADLATAFEVLEHVFDPLTFLRASARVVRPGGLLFFSTLSASGFDIQVLWEHSRSVTPPQHLNFPTVSGAERLIERAGMQVVEITTPGQLDVEIVRNRLAADPSIPVPRFARTLAAADDTTRQAFQQMLSGHRLSSHIQCVARTRPPAPARAQ